MSRLQHGLVVVVLMVAAAALLTWKTSRSAIIYADGLRYIRQAKLIETGEFVGGLFNAIDHPAYPLAISWRTDLREATALSTGNERHRWPRSLPASCW